MKTPTFKRRPGGYVSFLLVVVTCSFLTLLTVHAYKRAMEAQSVQGAVQLRVDYSEKDEAILRSIVAIAPNRAIRTMQQDSNVLASNVNPLSWETIFTQALDLANSRTSISSSMVTTLNIPKLKMGNAGDSTLATPSKIFAAQASETGYISAGINRSLGTGYPAPLSISTGEPTLIANDKLYPIISSKKLYGTLAQTDLNSATNNGDGSITYGLSVGTYSSFNRLKYPNINFGYAKPGDPFVAKRNWWSFSLDVGGNDSTSTLLARKKRDMVLSIYEIPSQLSISAASFMSLGKYASGDAWGSNVSISGGMFVGKAVVEGTTALNSLSSRRSMTLSSGTTIGGQTFANSPFTPGVRETYQITQGAFFPVSLASESGRAAFIPINRGADFFDRFSVSDETNTLSNNTWNDYSIGARQCAMRLDITAITSSTNLNPTMLRFQYLKTDGTRGSIDMPMVLSQWLTTLPPGYTQVASENGSYTFSTTTPVDVAYGASGGYAFIPGVTGTVNYNNSIFGDPLVGTVKKGYWRVRSPFEMKTLTSGQICVAVYPQRMSAFLASIGAAGTAVNNSLVVNVDYTSSGINNSARKPLIPCTGTDYGLVVKECGDLTSFTKGFSLVTNLRMYIGDDFNVTSMTPPTGYTPPVTASNPSGLYYPPCSLFAPEKRYGVDVDPFGVSLTGQIGSLASDTATNPVRPLDSKGMSGTAIGSNRITVNLRPITHPAELPPITMMNWLVLLEERKPEFY